jgi:hypothetical protein
VTTHGAHLEAKRQRLLQESARLRGELAQEGVRIHAALGFIDRGIIALRSLTSRPTLLSGALALLVILRPRRAVRWITRGAIATTLARRVLDVVAVDRRLRSRNPAD